MMCHFGHAFREKEPVLVMGFYDRIGMNAVQSASVKDDLINIDLIKGVEVELLIITSHG